MRSRLTRFHKVAALAQNPTPARRCIAAIVAGSIAFAIVQLLLGVLAGVGSPALWFSAFGAAIASAYAAATLRRGVAVAFGVLAVVWLLAELIAGVFAIMGAGLG